MSPNILIVTGIIIFIIVTWIKFSKHKFDYSLDDSTTRFCHSCGQRQTKVINGAMWNEEPDGNYWKDSDVIVDENCHCHDYVGV